MMAYFETHQAEERLNLISAKILLKIKVLEQAKKPKLKTINSYRQDVEALKLGVSALKQKKITDFSGNAFFNYSTKENILDAVEAAADSNGLISIDDIKLILNKYIKD